MTVWVVTQGSYSAYCIEGVFSTKEKADALVCLLRAENGDADAEQWELDERSEDIEGPIHQVWIYLVSGNSQSTPSVRRDIRSPKHATASLWTGSYNKSEWVVCAEAAESTECALKVAADFRQNWFRENPNAD